MAIREGWNLVKTSSKMSGEERRAAIIKAVRGVFVAKGFNGTTTRELAKAAGVSEALLFRHFPSKEALYKAIQFSCFKREGAKMVERLEVLPPSAETLVFLVYHMACHLLSEREQDEDERSFARLVLHSLTDDGEFARLGLQEGPTHWVQKIAACMKAAVEAGEVVDGHVYPESGGWFVQQLVAMVMFHIFPTKPAIDFHMSREELIKQMVWFCLRGLGLKDESIRRYFNKKALTQFEKRFFPEMA